MTSQPSEFPPGQGAGTAPDAAGAGIAATTAAAADEPAPRSRLLGRIRLALMYVFLLVIAWFALPTRLLVAIGLPLVVAGEAFRTWAAGHLLKSREMAVSGPYRYTQNPLYLGRFLILTGLCLMAYLPYDVRINAMPLLRAVGLRPGIIILNFRPANATLLVLGWALFFLYYLPRKIRVEGARLRRIHGAAYDAWFRSVPLLFPRLTPYGTNVRSWDSSRFLRNREHWMIAGVAAITLLFVWRAFTRP